MGLIETVSLKVRRGETPFYRSVHRVIKSVLRSNLPLPRFLRPVYRGLYELPFALRFVFQRAVSYLYSEPAFRSRCTQVGRNLFLQSLPDVRGHADIVIGNDVSIFGHLGVGSGRIFDKPRLMIGDRVDLGHNVFITVNKEVIIEEDVNVANNVQIADNDGHPRDPELRSQNLPPLPDEIKPIRICRRAWIGGGVAIRKGVTIGEGAIIGINSVVLTDIPAFALAIGNPARVLIKDVRVNAPTASQPANTGVSSEASKLAG